MSGNYASIYVIGSPDGPQKVGYSRSPETRCAALNAGRKGLAVQYSLTVPATNAKDVERYAHCLLFQRHRRGEWFDVSPAEAVDAVETAAAAVANGERPPFAPRLIKRRQAQLDGPSKGIRVDPAISTVLEKAAADNGLSVSSLIRMAVMAWLREKGYLP